MQTWPETRETLLARLHDPADLQAWEQFVELYQPLVYRVSRKRGLQDADARDVAQRVLWTVAQAAPDWKDGNPNGKFRGWLCRVTTNAAINLLQRDQRHRAAASTDVWNLLNRQEQDPEISAVWSQERKLEIFRFAAQAVRARFSGETWQCFWRTTVGDESVQKVASEVGMSIGAVYAARSRVMASIRRKVERIESLEEGQAFDEQE